MAKFCSKECEESGSICNFCKNYQGHYGEGICLVTNEQVEACDGCNCDDFICFNVDQNKIM